MTNKNQARFSLIILGLMLLSGCVTMQRPLYLHNNYVNNSIQNISILKAIDGRTDTKVKLDMLSDVSIPISKSITKKGYNVNVIKDIPKAENLLEIDVREGDPEFYGSFASYGKYILFPVLIDCTSKLTFGSTGNAEVAVYLIDTENKCLVWRDKGIGKTGQGGLIGMAMVSAMAKGALDLANKKVVKNLPNIGRPFKT